MMGLNASSLFCENFYTQRFFYNNFCSPFTGYIKYYLYVGIFAISFIFLYAITSFNEFKPITKLIHILVLKVRYQCHLDTPFRGRLERTTFVWTPFQYFYPYSMIIIITTAFVQSDRHVAFNACRKISSISSFMCSPI